MIACSDSELCPCGNRGCLETLTSIPALVRRAEERTRHSATPLKDGIGAGILQNGKYWGAGTPSFCQIGHMIACPDSELCPCGNRGCLETLTSIPALVRRAEERTRHSAAPLKDGKDFLKRVEKHAPVCEGILRETAKFLGIVIANGITFAAITNLLVRSVRCHVSDLFFRTLGTTSNEMCRSHSAETCGCFLTIRNRTTRLSGPPVTHKKNISP